jgi:hypothetical protein
MAFDPRSQKRIIQLAFLPLNDHERFALTALSLLFACAAQAQIYQWQDENNQHRPLRPAADRQGPAAEA